MRSDGILTDAQRSAFGMPAIGQTVYCTACQATTRLVDTHEVLHDPKCPIGIEERRWNGMSTGDQLRELRERCNLKRPQVEAATGISAGRISRIESGTTPKDDEVARLKEYYERWLDRTGKPEPEPERPQASEGDVMPRPSRPKSTKPLPESALLRFTDGAVIDFTRCPRSIHVRHHWLWDAETKTATCKCVAAPQDETEEELSNV